MTLSGCGSVLHRIVGLPVGPLSPFQLVQSPTLGIRVEGTQLSQVGTYNYYIEGCLVFAYDGFENCARTEDLTYEIYNPCLTTTPVVEPITRLVAPRLDVDGKFVAWVFPDSADQDTSDYGIGKCGPKTLEIYYSDQVTLVPSSFISWNSNLGLI